MILSLCRSLYFPFEFAFPEPDILTGNAVSGKNRFLSGILLGWKLTENHFFNIENEGIFFMAAQTL